MRKTPSSGTYVQYLVRGICMVFVPVFVAWIWWNHHNKGTVDRRLSTIALLVEVWKIEEEEEEEW